MKMRGIDQIIIRTLEYLRLKKMCTSSVALILSNKLMLARHGYDRFFTGIKNQQVFFKLGFFQQQ